METLGERETRLWIGEWTRIYDVGYLVSRRYDGTMTDHYNHDSNGMGGPDWDPKLAY